MPRMNKRKRDEMRFGRPERLADLIRQKPVLSHKDCPPEIHRTALGEAKEWLDKSITVEANNVSAYLCEVNKGFEQFWESLPPVPLPFQRVFFEFDGQGCVISQNPHIQITNGHRFWGHRAYTFSTSPDGNPVGPLTSFVADALEAGTVHVKEAAPVGDSVFYDSGTREKLARHYVHCLSVSYLAVAFMLCKNVTVSAEEPDAALNRERRKAGLKPFVRYHTINIEPMKQVLRTEGGVEENGLKRALHICRGHFATYSDSFMGRPLAEPMTVWRPAHVRGQASEGVVFKDYRVSAPGQEGTA